MKPLIAGIILVMLIIASCHHSTETATGQSTVDASESEIILDTNLLKQSIKNYLENSFQEPSHGGKTFAGYHLLGVSTNHDTINAFIWAYIMNYSAGISGPSENSGLSIPLKIRLLYSNEKIQVQNAEYPEEGENYAESVRNIFPDKFQEWIWGSEKYQTIQLLKQEMLEEATAYYDKTAEGKDSNIVALKDTLNPVTNLIIQEGPQVELIIIVPEDLPAYESAMTRFVQTGEGTDPADTFQFIKKRITVIDTSEPEKNAAQLAADQIHIGGGPGRVTIIHFKIHQDTAYVVFDIDVDGWSGASVAIAKLRPLVEKTLLEFPGIDKVIFDFAPSLPEGGQGAWGVDAPGPPSLKLQRTKTGAFKGLI